MTAPRDITADIIQMAIQNEKAIYRMAYEKAADLGSKHHGYSTLVEVMNIATENIDTLVKLKKKYRERV